MQQHEFENEIEVMVKVKFNYSPGYPATHEDPGMPNEYEDIELSCEFEDQPKSIQDEIIEQCAEAVDLHRDNLLTAWADGKDCEINDRILKRYASKVA